MVAVVMMMGCKPDCRADYGLHDVINRNTRGFQCQYLSRNSSQHCIFFHFV